MSRLLVCLFALGLTSVALAGCTTNDTPADDGTTPTTTTTAPPGATTGPAGSLDIPETCPGHWHAQTAFYLRNESVPLTYPTFTVNNAVHLHSNSGNLLHFHPGPTRCIPFSEALAWLGMALNNTTWRLDEKHGSLHGTYTDGATHGNDTERLHLFYETWNGTWESRHPGDLVDQQLPDGSRVLVSYGNVTAADLAWQMDQVAPIPDEYAPR